MSSSSVSPDKSPIQQARNAGGVEGPPAHVAPNNAAAAAAAVVDPLEEGLGQQGSDSSGHRPSQRLRDFLGAGREGSPNQISPDDSGRGPPPPVQRGPDLFVRNFVGRRPAQGGPGGAPAGHWLPQVVAFFFLTFNTATAAYQSWGDIDAISFIVPTYVIMLSLFVNLKLFLAAPPNSGRRDGLTVSVWFLTVVLTSGFIYKITAATAKPTLQFVLILWAMPAAIGASVFIIFWDRFRAPLGEELPDIPLDEALV